MVVLRPKNQWMCCIIDFFFFFNKDGETFVVNEKLPPTVTSVNTCKLEKGGPPFKILVLVLAHCFLTSIELNG